MSDLKSKPLKAKFWFWCEHIIWSKPDQQWWFSDSHRFPDRQIRAIDFDICPVAGCHAKRPADGKILSQEEWDGVYDVLELVQLRAVNDSEWFELQQRYPFIFTPEFLELRATRVKPE
jgi:hypothetical protein